MSGSAQKYPVMNIEDICRLEVVDCFDPAGAVLYLWVPVSMIPEGLQVVRAWGFHYKTLVAWRKVGRKGLGYWYRNALEVVLFGTMGHVLAFRHNHDNLIEAPVKAHSVKPQEMADLIVATAQQAFENGKLANPPRYLELFSRKPSDAVWTRWGLSTGKELRVRTTRG